MKKRIIVLCMAMAFLLCACVKPGQEPMKLLEIYGGANLEAEIVAGKTEKKIELPMISTRKIENIELSDYSFAGGKNVDFSMAGAELQGEYSGYYVYKLALNYKDNETAKEVDTRLSKLVFLIDEVECEYPIKDFHIINEEKLSKEVMAETGKNLLAINKSESSFGSYICETDGYYRRFVSLSLTAQEAVNLKKFKVLGQNGKITSLCVNGVSVKEEKLNCKLDKGDKVTITLVLTHVSAVNEESLIEDTFAIVYTNNEETQIQIIDDWGFESIAIEENDIPLAEPITKTIDALKCK